MMVYGILNCNTVKKALHWLKENKINFEFHDFKKKGITKEKLNVWCDNFGWEMVLNRKGLTWKKLPKTEQIKINNQELAVEYLINNTSAIKRPVIEKNNQTLLIGFDEATYAQAIL